MIDIIRSVHFHVPSMVDRSLSIRVGCQGQAGVDLHELCGSLFFEQCLLLSELTINEYLLVLFAILSRINSLFCTLGILTTSYLSIQEKMESLSGHQPHTPRTTNCSDEEYSKFVPFTPDHEYRRMHTQLQRALEGWQTSFTAQQSRFSGHDHVRPPQQSIWVLYDFARLLLEAGPTVYLVPSLAGYTPEDFSRVPLSIKRPCEPHTTGIRFNESALLVAMKVLEGVELGSTTRSQASPDQEESHCTPLWYPLALFYSALVAWCHVCEDAATEQSLSRSPHTLMTPRRLLQMLFLELSKLQQDWSCARSMAAVVAQLLK